MSNAGARGIIENTSEQGRADLKRVRDLTDGSVGANIALLFIRNPAVVDLLAANDIRFVTTSAGDPKLMIDRLHDAAITVFHVVGTLAAARKAVDAGVDGLVVEGVEGGGFRTVSEPQRWCCCRWWRPTSTCRSWPREGSATRGQWPPRWSWARTERVQQLYFDGDMEASVANTGQVASRIDDLPPAADIIKHMWTGCREVLAATADPSPLTRAARA